MWAKISFRLILPIAAQTFSIKSYENGSISQSKEASN
jgi:hypothetical protein